MFTTNDCQIEATADEFKELINSSPKIVVHFYADWCMNCLMMTPILDDLAEELNEITFIRVNIEDVKEVADKFNVSNIPCVVMVKDGLECHRLTGMGVEELIEERVRKHLL